MVKKKTIKKTKKSTAKKRTTKHVSKKGVKRISRKVKQTKITPKNEKEIALDFATQVHKKFSNLVKATILFGSQAKHNKTPGSDIDIVIIIDDASIQWDLELISWYREELAKIISRNRYSVDLHINTIKITTWWSDLMHGDPVIINILRYGEVLIDLGGFFNPVKALLLQGKIHSTPEAVYESLQRAPIHLARSHQAEMGAIEGIYWSMVDSSQAALMTIGILPPSPEHITGMLKESFVDKKILNIEFIKWYRDIHDLHKNIVHGNIRDIKGADIDVWQDRAEKFIRKMGEIINNILDARNK